MGATYLELDSIQKTIKCYKEVTRIRPNDAEVHFALRVAYLKYGDKDSAIEEYKIIKELDKELAKELFKYIYE